METGVRDNLWHQRSRTHTPTLPLINVNRTTFQLCALISSSNTIYALNGIHSFHYTFRKLWYTHYVSVTVQNPGQQRERRGSPGAPIPHSPPSPRSGNSELAEQKQRISNNRVLQWTRPQASCKLCCFKGCRYFFLCRNRHIQPTPFQGPCKDNRFVGCREEAHKNLQPVGI